MGRKQIIYMEKSTGNIRPVRTELEGQLLGKNWTKIVFIKNDKGENVMRVNFGLITIDIQPNGEKEVVDNGN